MRIASVDIETTDLKALMGRTLCCSFKELGKEPYTFRLDSNSYKGKSKIDDSKLVTAIRDEWENYDMIIAYNGKMFDIPFINARLALAGERPFRPHFVCDPMYYFNGGSSMRIGSRKLDNVAKYFKLGEQKTDITWDNWALAAMGDKDAMDYVVSHCEADVRVLEQVYWKALPYVSTIHR